MKNFLLPFFLTLSTFALNAQRYLSEIFDSVSITENIEYAENYSIITGAAALQILHADIYQPEGDNATDRPMVVLIHGGFFLPVQINGRTTGSKNDYAIVEICTRLAKMGYVTAAIEYRLGWNPLAPASIEIANGLVIAAYRGLQDLKTFIRFANLQVENGNPWKIDPGKIAVWGQGSGGFIALMGATIDDQNEFYIPKFFNPDIQGPFIDTTLLGNFKGTSEATINIPNHTEYSDDIQFTFNAGGGLFDTSWVDENSNPIASAHVVHDPYHPFGISWINGMTECESAIISHPNVFIINIAGSKCFINLANTIGINDSLMCLDDEITLELLDQSLSEPNLWAIHRPQIEEAPWEYWDADYWDQIPHPSGGTFHTVSLLTNPDMSLEKANRYLDTLLWFFTPRACISLDLDCEVTRCLVSTEELFTVETDHVLVFPNPGKEQLSFQCRKQIRNVEIYNSKSQLIFNSGPVLSNYYKMDLQNLPGGLYIAKVRLNGMYVVKKIIFQ